MIEYHSVYLHMLEASDHQKGAFLKVKSRSNFKREDVAVHIYGSQCRDVLGQLFSNTYSCTVALFLAPTHRNYAKLPNVVPHLMTGFLTDMCCVCLCVLRIPVDCSTGDTPLYFVFVPVKLLTYVLDMLYGVLLAVVEDRLWCSYSYR